MNISLTHSVSAQEVLSLLEDKPNKCIKVEEEKINIEEQKVQVQKNETQSEPDKNLKVEEKKIDIKEQEAQKKKVTQILHFFKEKQGGQIMNDEENISKFKKYIKLLKDENEVTCYEILKEDEEFENFLQLKLVKSLVEGCYHIFKVTNKLQQNLVLKCLLIHKTSRNLISKVLIT